MNRFATPFFACAMLIGFAACGSSSETHDSSAPLHDGFEFAVWPESGSTVFADTSIYVGSPAKVDHVHGTIAVLVGGDAPKVGSELPKDAMRFPVDQVFGDVKLPVGKQTIQVCLYDVNGKATEHGQAVEYTVEATPEEFGVEWLEPADGATVSSPLMVRFAVTGPGMSPSGQNALDKTLGHHHISIGKGFVTPGVMVPMGTDDYLHYGKAQNRSRSCAEARPVRTDHAVCRRRSSKLRQAVVQDDPRHR